ncbi:aspartate aminotransferase [Tribonema minus]|uniref:Aspartate aminotransferase n=1 Tax=Tribonema minus TaxID=303371 RepID=A0A836CM50_9STRA|nr:aspartate aminotransferase [Tribonema minus]
MDVLLRASELERQGRSIMRLEVGQPQSGAPAKVVAEAAKALVEQRLAYTEALGILPLRRRISQHYRDVYGVERLLLLLPQRPLLLVPQRLLLLLLPPLLLPPGAFLLAFLAAFDAGDRVAVASASYPCYRNILNALGCKVVTIPINAEYKVTSKELRAVLDKEDRDRQLGTASHGEGPASITPPVKGIILSSPSNPTGAMLSGEELAGLSALCEERGITFISDEIYHGICFEGQRAETALTHSRACVVINSFSKYFSMTGWRLGWMVVPPAMVDAVNRLAQNLYINAPTLSQASLVAMFLYCDAQQNLYINAPTLSQASLLGAVAAFDCEEELEGHIRKYSENRRILLQASIAIGRRAYRSCELDAPGLTDMGLTEVAPSDGAFYLYVDTSRAVRDSGAGSIPV